MPEVHPLQNGPIAVSCWKQRMKLMIAEAKFFTIFGKYREKGQRRISAIVADLPVKELLEVPIRLLRLDRNGNEAF